jgi:hypothetical protein
MDVGVALAKVSFLEIMEWRKLSRKRVGEGKHAPYTDLSSLTHFE